MLKEGLTVSGGTKPTSRSPTKPYPWVGLQSDIHRLGVRSRTKVRPTGHAAGAERVGMLTEGVTVSGGTKPTPRSPAKAYPWVGLQSDIHWLGVRSRTEVRPTGHAAGAERVGILKEGLTVGGQREAHTPITHQGLPVGRTSVRHPLAGSALSD